MQPRQKVPKRWGGSVNRVLWVYGLSNCIPKCPIATVESASIVDHLRHPMWAVWHFPLNARPIEYRLTAVGVRNPFVKDQSPMKILAIINPGQYRVREVIMNCQCRRRSRIAGAKMEPRLYRDPAVTHNRAALRMRLQEELVNQHQRGLRGGDSQFAEQDGADELIEQDTPTLRVLQKFYSIAVAVIALNQLRLCAAAQSANTVACNYQCWLFSQFWGLSYSADATREVLKRTLSSLERVRSKDDIRTMGSCSTSRPPQYYQTVLTRYSNSQYFSLPPSA